MPRRVFLIFLLLGMSCSTGKSLLKAGHAAECASISPAEAHALIEENAQNSPLVILDLRTESEYGKCRLARARNLDFYRREFDSSLAALDRRARYVIYCGHGIRSAAVLLRMRRLGFLNVYEIRGGIAAWAAMKLPLAGNNGHGGK